jgi:hypothetical protein
VNSRRWAVETAFSTYKRLYGENTMSRNIENIERDLKAKAYIYNMLIKTYTRDKKRQTKEENREVELALKIPVFNLCGINFYRTFV